MLSVKNACYQQNPCYQLKKRCYLYNNAVLSDNPSQIRLYRIKFACILESWQANSIGYTILLADNSILGLFQVINTTFCQVIIFTI